MFVGSYHSLKGCVFSARRVCSGAPSELKFLNYQSGTEFFKTSSPEFYSSHVCPTALVGGVAVVGGGCRGDVD